MCRVSFPCQGRRAGAQRGGVPAGVGVSEVLLKLAAVSPLTQFEPTLFSFSAPFILKKLDSI